MAYKEENEWTTEVSGFDSSQGESFSSPKRPDQLPVPDIVGTEGLEVKRQRRKADHSPPSSAEVENDGAIPPLCHTSSGHTA
jgi:hypothetical protein